MSVNASESVYDKYFYNKSLRMDVYHCGNHDDAQYMFDKFIIEKYWGGSQTNLIDEFNFGSNLVKVIDANTNTVIYTHGYCTLFQEWQTSDEAKNLCRCYEESVSMPLPKNKAIIELYCRDKKGVFQKKFSMKYNPDEIYNTTEQKYSFPVYNVMVNGDAAHKVDIVIIPDGYTQDELEKFKKDCDQFIRILKTFEPYKSQINNFNVRGVLAPSEESGVDIPSKKVWVKTIADCHFDTFYSDRYCTTESYFSIKDLAACAPYDQIYILVNSSIYGGGGIYNYYSVSTSGNMSSAKVIVHEFGHAFAGLGDEYVEVGNTCSDLYPADIEPWEFNLTTLVNFDSKWKSLLDKNTPIPTPAEKPYIGKLGVFEGGGYLEKGIYRPSYDCMMKTFDGDTFCGACSYMINKMIEFYSK